MEGTTPYRTSLNNATMCTCRTPIRTISSPCMLAVRQQRGASQRKWLRRRKWSSRRNSRKILRRRTEGEGRNGCKGGEHRRWRSGRRDLKRARRGNTPISRVHDLREANRGTGGHESRASQQRLAVSVRIPAVGPLLPTIILSFGLAVQGNASLDVFF